MLIMRQKRDVWKNGDRGNIYNKQDIGGKEEYRFYKEWRLHSKDARKRYTQKGYMLVRVCDLM